MVVDAHLPVQHVEALVPLPRLVGFDEAVHPRKPRVATLRARRRVRRSRTRPLHRVKEDVLLHSHSTHLMTATAASLRLSKRASQEPL